MNKQSKSLETQLFWCGLAAIAAGGLLLWIYEAWILPHAIWKGCIWDKYFGFYCPGCGGTRAVYALLQGHFLLSLWYHPLVLYAAVIFSVFMASQMAARLTRYRYFRGIRFHNWYLIGAVIIIIVNFVLKNLLRLVWHISI